MARRSTPATLQQAAFSAAEIGDAARARLLQQVDNGVKPPIVQTQWPLERLSRGGAFSS